MEMLLFHYHSKKAMNNYVMCRKTHSHIKRLFQIIKEIIKAGATAERKEVHIISLQKHINIPISNQ